MITSIKSSLTDREKVRILKAYEISQNVIGHIVDQPSVDNALWMTLEDLCKKETSYNQLDITPSKVKSILLKSDTGLVQNEFFLFNHIILGKTTNGDLQTIVSGRHRLAALVTVCDLLNLPLSEVGLFIIVCTYPTEKLLARSIAAYNTNRTMTGAERERVMVSSELDGEEPTAFNAKGKTSNKRDCKSFFKQVCLTSVIDCIKESDYDELGMKVLTANNQGRVFGYMFDMLTEDNPEMFKQLKSGNTKVWSTIELLASYAFDEHYLDQPEGQVSRGGDILNDLAFKCVKAFFINNTDNEVGSETTEETAF